MTILLNEGTVPENLPVKAVSPGIEAQILGFEGVGIGEYFISMQDFCSVVEYVLRNTNLGGESDPRLRLIARIKTAKTTEGYTDSFADNPRRIIFEGDRPGTP